MAVQTGQAATAMERGTTSALAQNVTCHQRHGLVMSPGVLSAQVPSAAASAMDVARPEKRAQSRGSSAGAKTASTALSQMQQTASNACS